MNSPRRVRALPSMLFAAATAAGMCLPAAATVHAASLVTTAPSCLNVPVTPAELLARDCLWTGPESLIAVGASPGNQADARIVAVDGSRRHAFTLPNAGALHLSGTSPGRVCVAAAAWSVAVDVTTGRTSACAGAPAAPATVSVIGDGASGTGVIAPAADAAPPGRAPVRPMATADHAPAISVSSYIHGDAVAACPPTATFACTLFAQGASAAPGTMVILDFGAPCYVPGTAVYGTQLFNTGHCTPAGTLTVLMNDFVRGYEATHTAGAPLILAAGTSNSLTGADPQAGYALTTGQMQAHAQAWSQQVVQPVRNAAAGAPAPVTLWAANDIEQSSGGDYYGPDPSLPWVDTYAVISGHGGGRFACAASSSDMLADYGDDVPGAGGWTQSHIYHAAFGSPAACAVPEIYYSSMAASWQRTNQWAASAGLPQIAFTGVMSENGLGGTLSAGDGWAVLAGATGQAAPYLTVITEAEPVGNQGPWLRQTYLDLLGRAADPAGLASWTALLAGGWTRAQVASSLTHSPEYDALVVHALFQQYLHRRPDSGGLAFYAGRLANGGTDEALAVDLLQSQEYLVHAGGSGRGFVAAMYTDALDRTADAAGAAHWLGALDTGASRAEVAGATVYGAERDGILATHWYSLFLLRSPDGGGLNDAVGRLQAGAPDESLIAAFLASSEYGARSPG